MKVPSKFLFIMSFLFLFSAASFSSAFAQDGGSSDGDGWLLFGYSYTFPDSPSMDGLQGPATVTIGGDLWRFIGLEVTLGGRWDTQSYMSNFNIAGNYFHATDVLWSFDIKPYLMLQPKIGIDLISLRPYFGIGPSFHFTGVDSTEKLLGISNQNSTSTFDVGFSAKAGVRLQALKFFFVGVGTEYLYHKAKMHNKNYDFSGWTVGAEVGFIW